MLALWQFRLAQWRASTWHTEAVYAVAAIVVIGVTALVFAVGALILALFPPAPVGRGLGILVLLSWGCQCRDRWVALGPAPRVAPSGRAR